jgi:hypothetical protein
MRGWHDRGSSEITRQPFRGLANHADSTKVETVGLSFRGWMVEGAYRVEIDADNATTNRTERQIKDTSRSWERNTATFTIDPQPASETFAFTFTIAPGHAPIVAHTPSQATCVGDGIPAPPAPRATTDVSLG